MHFSFAQQPYAVMKCGLIAFFLVCNVPISVQIVSPFCSDGFNLHETKNMDSDFKHTTEILLTDVIVSVSIFIFNCLFVF